MDAKLLAALSAIGVVVGFFFLSEATMGVGIVGIAACFGIWSRLAQASNARKELIERIVQLEARLDAVKSATAYTARRQSEAVYQNGSD
jgi:hypothetical protein